MSDHDLGEDAPLTDEQGREGIELAREMLMQHGGAAAFAAKLNEGILEMSGLDPRTFILVRIAAAAAMNAPAISWDVNLEMAEELGIESEEVLGVLVAVTPVIGAARFMQAVTHIIED